MPRRRGIYALHQTGIAKLAINEWLWIWNLLNGIFSTTLIVRTRVKRSQPHARNDSTPGPNSPEYVRLLLGTRHTYRLPKSFLNLLEHASNALLQSPRAPRRRWLRWSLARSRCIELLVHGIGPTARRSLLLPVRILCRTARRRRRRRNPMRSRRRRGVALWRSDRLRRIPLRCLERVAIRGGQARRRKPAVHGHGTRPLQPRVAPESLRWERRTRDARLPRSSRRGRREAGGERLLVVRHCSRKRIHAPVLGRRRLLARADALRRGGSCGVVRHGREVAGLLGGIGLRKSDLLELLHHGAGVPRARLVLNVGLGGGQHAADAVDELEGVGLGVEVDVERMELVVILVLVARVVGGKMPLAGVGGLGGRQRDEAVVLV